MTDGRRCPAGRGEPRTTCSRVLPPDCDASRPRRPRAAEPARRSAGCSPRAALAREESRGTHTRLDFPERSNDLPRPVLRGRLDGSTSSSRCPSRSGSRAHDPRPRSADRRWSARSSRARWPRTSVCSATSRRSRSSTRTRPRPAASSRAAKACSPARPPRPRCSPSSTRRCGSSGTSPTATTLQEGQVLGERRRARCARSSAPSAPRSNLLQHCSGIATLTRRYVRAAHGKARIRDTRKTTTGAARAGEGGGARRRWLQPSREPLGRDPHQGQPPRRTSTCARRSTGPGPAGRAGSSRSSATRSSRWARRSRRVRT